MKFLSIGYLGSIGLVLCLGLMMIFNTTSAEVVEVGKWGIALHALIRQLLYLMLSVFLGLGVVILGYKQILKWTPFFLLSVSILLALVLIPGVGQKINGARRWISILGNSLQPSEFAKYAVCFFFIEKMGFSFLEKKFPYTQFFKILFLCLIPIGLIGLEPDNGTVVIILAALFGLFILTKIPTKIWLIPIISVVTLGGFFAIKMPHVQQRIDVYLHPEKDILGKGHQSYQSKIAIGSGGLTGRGVGSSIQKFGFLPEARSDYIGAIFAEETGFIGIFTLISLYLIHLLCGVGLSFKIPDFKGALVVLLSTFMITLQAFINLGVISCILPSKGTNLPFFSHGGSSMIASVFAIFMTLSCIKEFSAQKNKAI